MRGCALGSLAIDYAPRGGVRRQSYALLLRDESLSELAPPLQASAPKAQCGAQRPYAARSAQGVAAPKCIASDVQQRQHEGERRAQLGHMVIAVDKRACRAHGGR